MYSNSYCFLFFGFLNFVTELHMNNSSGCCYLQTYISILSILYCIRIHMSKWFFSIRKIDMTKKRVLRLITRRNLARKQRIIWKITELLSYVWLGSENLLFDRLSRISLDRYSTSINCTCIYTCSVHSKPFKAHLTH